jgi:hypothetical protein
MSVRALHVLSGAKEGKSVGKEVGAEEVAFNDESEFVLAHENTAEDELRYFINKQQQLVLVGMRRHLREK